MQTPEERQLELESASVVEGLDRINKTLIQAPLAESAAGQRVLSKSIQALSAVIAREQRCIEIGARRPHGMALVSLDADKLAFITLKGILLALGERYPEETQIPVTRLARDIGRYCQRQRNLDVYHGHERDLFQAIQSRNKNRWNARKRAEAANEEFNELDWAEARLDFHLGGALIDLALLSTKLFTRNVRTKKPTTLSLSKKALAEIEGLLQEQADYVLPFYLPMVIPPLPWKGPEGGGYLSISPGLIKEHGDSDPEENSEPKGLRIPCEAINALQETPWRINRAIFDIFTKATDHSSSWSREPDKKAQEYAGTLSLSARLSACERLVKEPKIYFPHQIDWRGRAYAVPPIVHPQADDPGRALIQFAQGKPLGDRGAHWLAVDLANLYGESKLPFPKRVAWVEENRVAILDSARRPLEGAGFWKKADKPWRFLAVAMEWAGSLEFGAGFKCHTPVAMDGTCNGLQHLSALGRDPQGGAWTNLVPNASPQDIYQQVADQLTSGLENDSPQHPTMAARWLPLVTRSLVKPATMTTPYGVTRQGIQKQILSALRDRKDFANAWSAAIFLAPHIQASIAKVVVKATAITVWLRAVADRFSKKGLALSWIPPSGLHIRQCYRTPRARRIKTAIGTLLIYEPDSAGKLDRRKQKDAIVANLIHSLDAAHMMLTVCELHSRGLREFAMVHDSYAVHACDVDLMNTVLREQFVRVHTDFTLGTLSLELKKLAPKLAFPLPPAVGTLSIQEVEQSEYFFS